MSGDTFRRQQISPRHMSAAQARAAESGAGVVDIGAHVTRVTRTLEPLEDAARGLGAERHALLEELEEAREARPRREGATLTG